MRLFACKEINFQTKSYETWTHQNTKKVREKSDVMLALSSMAKQYSYLVENVVKCRTLNNESTVISITQIGLYLFYGGCFYGLTRRNLRLSK